jgi:hypothetical protein
MGRGLPKKTHVTVQTKEGAHRAVSRNDTQSFPGHVSAVAVTRRSLPGVPSFPVEAGHMSRRGSQRMKMVFQGLVGFGVLSDER